MIIRNLYDTQVNFARGCSVGVLEVPHFPEFDPGGNALCSSGGKLLKKEEEESLLPVYYGPVNKDHRLKVAFERSALVFQDAGELELAGLERKRTPRTPREPWGTSFVGLGSAFGNLTSILGSLGNPTSMQRSWIFITIFVVASLVSLGVACAL